MDTLVDVVGTFVLVEALGVEQVVRRAPSRWAAARWRSRTGGWGCRRRPRRRCWRAIQVVGGPEMRELTTPTGALLVGQLGAEQGPLPAMTVKAVGYGAGTMKLERGPNVLRVVLGERGRARGASAGAAARRRRSWNCRPTSTTSRPR